MFFNRISPERRLENIARCYDHFPPQRSGIARESKYARRPLTLTAALAMDIQRLTNRAAPS